MLSEQERPGRLADGSALVLLAIWITITAASQHPVGSFDRLRKLDPYSQWIPNWRFFAPNPGIHDVQVAVRMLLTDGSQTKWLSANEIKDRSWTDMFYAPNRRNDKRVSDLMAILVQQFPVESLSVIETQTSYIELRKLALKRVRQSLDEFESIRGYQFALVKDPGYDVDEDIELVFLSRFEPFRGLVDGD